MIHSFAGDKPKTWDLTLAQAEFAFNSMVNRSMGLAPFAIVYTKLPNLVVDLRELPPGATQKSAETMAEHISQLYREVRERIKAANECYKLKVDQHHRFKAFKVGDLAMIQLRKE